MDIPPKEQLRKQFGHFSRAELEYRMEAGVGDVRQTRLWLRMLDDDAREDAVSRANASLEVAKQAAENSRMSARFAMWAAIVALIGVIVTVVRDFIIH